MKIEIDKEEILAIGSEIRAFIASDAQQKTETAQTVIEAAKEFFRNYLTLKNGPSSMQSTVDFSSSADSKPEPEPESDLKNTPPVYFKELPSITRLATTDGKTYYSVTYAVSDVLESFPILADEKGQVIYTLTNQVVGVWVNHEINDNYSAPPPNTIPILFGQTVVFYIDVECFRD